MRRSLATDGKDLFWGEFTDESGLLMWAADISGGGVARNLGRWYDYPSAQTIALGPEHVYWLRDDGGGSVVGVPKAGGDETVTVLPSPPERRLSPGPIVYAADRIWLATLGCSHIVQIDPAAGETDLFEMGPYDDVGSATGLAIHDGNAYCANGSTIHSLSIADGAVELVVDGQEYVGPLLWVEGNLYFINNRALAGDDERLMLWRPGDDAATDVGPAFGLTPQLLYDNARRTLYWEIGYSRTIGGVAQFVLDSLATEQLLERQTVMGGITQDADYLYWLGDRDIFRTPKPARN